MYNLKWVFRFGVCLFILWIVRKELGNFLFHFSSSSPSNLNPPNERRSFAFVSALTSDDYNLAKLLMVLGRSLTAVHEARGVAAGLREQQPDFDLVLMVSEQVSRPLKHILDHFWTVLHELPPEESAAIQDADRLRLFVKLQAWSLVQYDRVVYLEPDSLALKPVAGALFVDSTGGFAAVPDCCDLFHTGLLSLAPSLDQMQRLRRQLDTFDSTRKDETAFWNDAFPIWTRLPYRLCSQVTDFIEREANWDLAGSSLLQFEGRVRPWDPFPKNAERRLMKIMSFWFSVYKKIPDHFKLTLTDDLATGQE